MSNIDKRALAMTKELATLMVERFSMNPVSSKLLNEAWKKEFPDEVAIAERMLALLNELERKEEQRANWFQMAQKLGSDLEAAEKRIAELTEKPIGWTDEQELRDVEKLGCGYLFNANPITPHADPRRVILLYAAAAGKGE